MIKVRLGSHSFEFGNQDGTVFTRGHHPGKFGDDKSDNKSISLALQVVWPKIVMK